MIEKYKYCSNHPNIPFYTICGNCKDPYCKNCLNEGTTYYYCNKQECFNKYEIEKYYAENEIFCEKCSNETTDENAGNMKTINFIGTSFSGKRNECEICHSYISNKCFVFLGIPVFKYGTFRIRIITHNYSWLWGTDETSYISRRLKR